MKTLEVTDETFQEFQKYMSMLKINKDTQVAAAGGAAAMEVDEVEDDVEIFEDQESEVSSIMDHAIDPVSGLYTFRIKFVDRKSEWIRDVDTNCERSISAYCSSKGIKTVYVFCRVSSKGQIGENHVSLDAQEGELAKMAKEKFPEHRVKVYKISASAYKDIPDCLKMIGEAAEMCAGSQIIIYRVDRLSRNIVKYLSWMENLNNKKVGIHSFADKISYDTDKLVFIQKVLDSQKESALIGERIKMSIKKRKERGDECIGGVAYGKKCRRTETGKLVVVANEEELSVIDYIKSSKAPSITVASILNKKGLKKKGRSWSKKMVEKIRPNLKKVAKKK